MYSIIYTHKLIIFCIRIKQVKVKIWLSQKRILSTYIFEMRPMGNIKHLIQIQFLALNKLEQSYVG